MLVRQNRSEEVIDTRNPVLRVGLRRFSRAALGKVELLQIVVGDRAVEVNLRDNVGIQPQHLCCVLIDLVPFLLDDRHRCELTVRADELGIDLDCFQVSVFRLIEFFLLLIRAAQFVPRHGILGI